MTYATTAEWALYTRRAIPEDLDRLLDRASELVDEAIIPNIIDPNHADYAEHLVAAQKATCAIVEFWMEAGEETAISGRGRIEEYKVGNVNIRYGKGSADGDTQVLPERARRHLLTAGLLYRGVSY